MASQLLRKEQAADQCFAIGEFAAGGVGHAESLPIALGHFDELGVEQITRTTAVFHRRAFQFQDRVAHLRYGGTWRQWRTEGYCHRVWKLFGPLPEKLAVFKTEDAAPELIEVHRNDRDVRALDDFFKATLERQQPAGAADRAFGEYADEMAVFQLVSCPLERLDDV